MRKSKDKKIEIREIVYSQDDEKSFGDIFVYEPENIEEQNLGSLFIIGELKDLPRNSSYVVNLLASKIKKEFYSNTKRSSEESLEAALGTANQTLSELANQGSGEYVGKLGMICGTYRDNKFYLSQVGKIRSLLVRDGNILDIIKEEDNKPASPKRTFNNIASGELADGDVVIFATLGLFSVFSLEKIKQLASSLELSEFASKLQEEIEEEDVEVVSALVLEVSGGKKAEKMDHTEVSLENQDPIRVYEPEVQMLAETKTQSDGPVLEETAGLPKAEIEDDGNETQENLEIEAEPETKDTNEGYPLEADEVELLMEDDNDISEDNALMMEDGSINDHDVELSEGGNENISLSDIIKEYEKIESRTSESDLAKDKNIENIIGKKQDSDFQDLDEQRGSGFIHQLVGSFKSFIAGINLGEVKTAMVKNASKLSSGEKEYKISSMSKKMGILSNKKAITAIIIILLFAAVAIPKLSSNKNDKAQAAQYQAMLTDSQSKLDQAGKASAPDSGKLYVEAKNLALEVKSGYGKFGTQADAIINAAQVEIDKIDKVAKADNLQTLATFDNANINKLVEVSGSFYAVDGKENSIYKVDAKNSKLSEVAKATGKLGDIKLVQNFQNQEILLSDGTAFSSFGLKGTALQKISAALDGSVQDFTAYGKYVYILSPAGNQIYKYQRSTMGLDTKTNWLKSGDVKDAVSMAIDQNVYVLYSDGQVRKFFTGQEYVENGNKFSISQPTDPITGASKIFTLTDQKYLYILEASKGRILVYDKNGGALVKQIMGDGFADIKDISVDSKETALTMLMSNKIVKISLQ